ncbi:MAG: DUF1893 domain-containing protein [Paludibacteraceae bacterium]|nr:DUF1893 domain-containing protein [Paludibacteraceae bacterium]
MKKLTSFFVAVAVAFTAVSCNGNSAQDADSQDVMADSVSVVYISQSITSDNLVRIFNALGVEPQGKVAVKVSTGESGNPYHLDPQLVKPLVDMLQGTIVECNTAYKGKRFENEDHKQVFAEHGWSAIAPIDLMDEEGDMQIPVRDTLHIKYDLVGSHLQNYDFMLDLSHFKGHPMGGFGGALKNLSIGVASRDGKAYIHTAGYTTDVEIMWSHVEDQDAFLESMAAAADGVAEYFKGKKGIVYINVMNNMSVDCDCVAHPEAPVVGNVGILASLDPVALDQACVDLVFNYDSKEGDDAAALIERINSRNGLRTIERAAEIGMGNKAYKLVSIDGDDMLSKLNADTLSLVVRNHGVETTYTQHGVRDLFELQGAGVLKGAAVADKVIGKGAAALMIKGGVRFVSTNKITEPALKMLTDAGIEVSYTEIIEKIINKAGDDICPLEKLLQDVTDADTAYPIIAEFVKTL